MESYTASSDNDIQAMRELITRLASKSTIVDFEEKILLSSVRKTARIWKQGSAVIGFAFVDNFNNLWFDTEADHDSQDKLETEMVAWGTACIKKASEETGTNQTLDCCCSTDNRHRLAVLNKHGFVLEKVRTLHYTRSLNQPIISHPLPAGFSIRCTKGRVEVKKLVTLHRAAFGTNNMTIEERLAMMSAPLYVPEMDLLVIAPERKLAAFCVCGFDDSAKKLGYTDPVGTHPNYQRIGLGKALISAGFIALKNAGADTVRLGTSSENIAMQKLAGELGFICDSEKLWFSKVLS